MNKIANFLKIFAALSVLFVFSCAHVSAQSTYNNGFKTTGTSADADYYEAPELVDGVYQIANAGNLWWFANYVNSNQKTATSVMPGDEVKAKAVLTAGINMEGSTRGSFPGIGYRAEYWDGVSTRVNTKGETVKVTKVVGLFTGSFDGQGYSISNFYQSNSSNYKALINTTGNGATIKNFTISGEVAISGGMQMGAVVGRIEGTTNLEDIHSSVNFTVASGKTISAIGGIVGQCSGTTSLNRCRYSGTITGNASYNALGGIVGNAEANLTFNNCLFDGSISSNSTQARTDVDNGIKIGGIFGRNNNVSKITNCLSIGTISVPSTADKGNVGIILGTQTSNKQLTITNTYYKTSNCTDGIGAVGNNSYTDKSSAVPTEITTQTWKEIKTALNNGSSIWGINSQVYPVPGETDQTQYTVTYNSKGGTEYSSVTKAVNTVITLPTPEKSGYLFTGWTAAEDGSGTKYDGGANYTITDDVTLYAQWAAAFTITFNSKGGSVCASVTKAVNTVITLPTPTRADYLFNGWNTAEDGAGTSYAAGASYTITANATLYAQWTLDEAGDYRNGFKKTGTSADEDYYQEPALVEGVYQIANAGNLWWIANKVLAGTASINVMVTEDINMDGTNHPNFPGIGYYTNDANTRKYFSGNLDGKNHRIYNCNISTPSGASFGGGLIACVTGNNSNFIKDFTLEGTVKITTGAYGGGAVGYIDKGYSVSGITSSVNITTDAAKTGGVIGYAGAGTNCSISKCRYNGNLTSTKYNTGGIIGETALPMSDCLFDGVIDNKCTTNDGSGIGGLACSVRNVTIQNCLVYGTIKTAINTTSTGKVFGKAENFNSGTVTLTNIYYKLLGESTPTIVYNANGKTVNATNVTEITTQTWNDIKTALNNGSTNWGISSQVYPVPGETDANQYTISFDSNGGSAVASITQSAGTTVTAPANPTKEGCVFAGWVPAIPTTMPAENMTCVAQWYVSITFNTDGGTAIEPIVQAEGTEVTAPANPTKTGYTFAGWKDASGNDVSFPFNMPSQNITLTAKWTVNPYTITFNMNGATSAQIAAITQDYGTTITKPEDPTKDGWNFAGWNPEIPNKMPAENLTCVAQWTQETYENGFNTKFSTCDDNVKYEKPVLLTADKCTEIGIATTYAGYYQVKNAGNMFWISKNFSSIENTSKFVMTADIDMDGTNHKDWEGIATTHNADCSTHFQGVFDGLGHKFTNYYLNITYNNNKFNYKSLFGVVTNATIKNFSIDGQVDIRWPGSQYGSVVGRVNGGTKSTIEDIYSTINFTVYDSKTPSSIGGIVGQSSGPTTVNRCRYSGTITGNTAYTGIGGIIGNGENTMTIDNCLFDGTITTTATPTRTGPTDGIKIGGIVGCNSGVSTITNCLSIGTISVPAAADKGNVGIVFGTLTSSNKLTITNTYYKTTNCTDGIGAVGNNSNPTKTSAAPTEITTQSWKTIKKKLNNDPAVGATVNWNIVAPTAYPIPMVNVEQEEVGIYYTIKFYDKATSTLIKEIQVLEDHDLEVPEEALKEGYSVTWEPALVSPVTANASYYGTYTINEYTITYKSEGTQFATQTYEYGATVTAPAAKPTKQGYEFVKWKDLPSTMPAENITVNAVFAELPTEISTFAELKAFRDVVNSAGGATKNAKLVADIDCGGEAFGEPIGVNANDKKPYHNNPTNPYVGTFDGQGHKITGLNINSAGHFVGLFGYVGVNGNAEKEANIKNLSVSGTINTSFLATESSDCTQSHLGTIGCLMNGTVSGIISNVKLTNSGCTDAHFGGIVGCTYAYASKKTIKNCAYIGTMEVDAYDCLGGILGYSQGGVEIEKCYFGGTIKQTCTAAKGTKMGGIAGFISSGTQDGRAFPITNNVSNGTMSVTTTGTNNVGVLLGQQAGLNNTYINGNYATSGTVADGFGTVKSMTMEEIEGILGFSVNLYVDGNGDISTNNIISVDAAKNYHLKVLYLDDLANAPTWPSDANSVKVNKLTYKRSGSYMTDGFISVCMPFALNADNLPGGSECKVKVFDQVKTIKDNAGKDVNVVYFKDYKVSESSEDKLPVAAGTPVFLYLPEGENGPRGKEWIVTLEDANGIDLVMEVSNPDDATRGIYGSFTTIKTGKWSESAPTYKIASDGKTLVKTTSTSSCYPYRAYLKLPQSSSNAPYRMSFDDLEDESDTAIDAFEELQSEQPCYNLQGQPVTSPTKGIVIAGGKKYIIR